MNFWNFLGLPSKKDIIDLKQDIGTFNNATDNLLNCLAKTSDVVAVKSQLEELQLVNLENSLKQYNDIIATIRSYEFEKKLTYLKNKQLNNYNDIITELNSIQTLLKALLIQDIEKEVAKINSQATTKR